MSEKEKNWEFGLGTEGHTVGDGHQGKIVLGENNFQYLADGLDWGNLPEGWTYK